jgi:hypothetical protein
MDVTCPIEGCGRKVKNLSGLNFHFKNNHPKEYKEIGWRKLKALSRKIPKEAPVRKESPKIIPPSGPEIAAWHEETEKKLGFFPSPASLAIIQSFTKSTDPSEFINESIINEGKRRGVMAAIIKTEGGESLNLLPAGDSDKEFSRLLQLVTAQNQMNQSYNPNSPMVMMIQAMKEKVNSGIGMGQFWKELSQMIMTLKMMEGM